MDLGGWLRRLGLEQYEAAFRENEIDDTVLPNLTAEDLKDLGVGIVGHRRKLLDAIAALRAAAGAPVPLSDASSATCKAAKDTAERRQVTVMFSDLVGSTSLSARMDPEDLREIISAYQTCIADTVRRFGGFVAKYMGDGVLIYFGYPQAHEDDAERAVRAGLDAIGAIGELKFSVPLQTRIGIATGLVVVGDLIGTGSAQEQAIVGETPNLAARLQNVAKPNAVVIAESTRRLLGSLFDLADLGLQDLKGIDAPARAWAVLQVSSVESRFEALHGSGLTELVGRREELDLLLRRWRRAASGEGQVVLLAGEPGIGKSRLIAALQERLQIELHTSLRYFCSPQRVDSAFYPIITQLERAAGFLREDTPEAQLEKLAALLVQASPPQEDQALLAELLSIPFKGRFLPLQLTPRGKKEKTFEALLRQLHGLAQQRPVLMLFEDVHWIDPSSRELLDLVLERVQHLPVLLVITFRPEFERIWAGQTHFTMLSLSRLDRREGAALVQQLVGAGTLTSDVVSEIVERTDGVPLFLEELTKVVLEADDRGARTALAHVSRTALAIPATLHASLMARLDRLGSPAREVAQVGAAIGREFSYELLRAVAQRNSAELDDALDQLVSAELIFRRGMPPDAEYSFKHALVQDAAYGTLLRGGRHKLHAAIGKALELLLPERASIEPELLAHHFAEAGQADTAISYWLKAGRRAAERSADQEAVRHLRRGLEMLTTLPHSTQKDQQELEFQLALGTPLAAQHGYGNPLVGAARDRAIALCEKLGDTENLLPSLYGQYAYCIASGRIPKALEYSQRCQSLAAHTGDRVARLIAHRAMGASLLEIGEFEAAKAQLEQILAIDRVEMDQALSVLYLADPHSSGLAYLALSLWALGYPDQAVAARQKAFEHAISANHANTSGIVGIYAGAQLSVLLGKMADVNNYVENLSAQLGSRVPLWAISCGQILSGWAIGCAEQLEGGIALMKQGIHAAEQQVRFHSPHYHSLLAVLQARAGDMQGSLSTIKKATELIAETGEYLWQADVLRIEGELQLLFGASMEAEASLVQALELARKQRARSFELRVAMSMARLWRDRGKGNEGRELLAPIYDWFNEGFDTRDLKEAKALLEELT
ncbi:MULTISPECIES: adenylate/guanylate cyclase domain-containing protein [Bradyrhizobium]|uniref:adenylate/guanylate cyclase domain-containing protein n=1 Tax=Bradyrhizobium TaxID=374 RepID=UPI00155E739A|nr:MULTISPECIES: adenylate/guanylate cyclase domain-containing protein [Bradyrhizobium]MDD1520704.1 adenylate/guanylate cyclase domain-containing protein [Bradyrhizobium sp. WBAH30]MDD1545755.1 adenylate/guanylate cyclase domain-containing protein [Bradyrhizobium sp. WBAH41]MDD1558984.1 adenylate/guanylate cyclase domain-containing protein [Bradyrhizobium sp. WBAH23]MDD1566366.1 adenylate/guanylate cyclase domain-containing protein [Bradyrhizobium sp. WBAH33]MDD1591959.1 adenylate/guanylate cy